MRQTRQLKTQIGYFLLNRSKPIPVSRKSKHWKDVESIGILYLADRESSPLIKKYAAKLRQEGKKVIELGFYDQKELSFDVNFTLNSEYLHRQHIQWNGLPRNDSVPGYVQEPFDILLNLYTGEILPLLWVSHHSKAQFRIGLYHQKSLPFFDMAIDAGAQHDIEKYIQTLDHYIRKL